MEYNNEIEINKIGTELLKKSCRGALQRCSYTSGLYEKVNSEFKSLRQMFNALKSKEGFFEKWLEYTEEYINQGHILAFRPTLDRIDEKGNYDIDNIQVLSYSENSMKAKLKKCVILRAVNHKEFEYLIVYGLNKALKLLNLTKKQAMLNCERNMHDADYVFFDTNSSNPDNLFISSEAFLKYELIGDDEDITCLYDKTHESYIINKDYTKSTFIKLVASIELTTLLDLISYENQQIREIVEKEQLLA